MAGPPTFFIAMGTALGGASGGGVDVSSVRLISSGGASVTPAFIEDTARTFDCRVKRTYGSTEAPTVTTSTNDDPFEHGPRHRRPRRRRTSSSASRTPRPVRRCRARHAPASSGCAGPRCSPGYADPAQTAAVIARGGWFRTGDLATVDDDGWLRIVGRLKDVIIRGGENISASEVEAALEAHPDVRHAVAVGYPDPLMGERVAAFVESAAPFDLEECRRWFSSRGIATFKTPEKVVRLERLPLLGSGKADRAALQRRPPPRSCVAVAARGYRVYADPELAWPDASPESRPVGAARRAGRADGGLRRHGCVLGPHATTITVQNARAETFGTPTGATSFSMDLVNTLSAGAKARHLSQARLVDYVATGSHGGLPGRLRVQACRPSCASRRSPAC